ncbi:hypothetical protein IHQ68_06415 [Chelatococcus sambhunathii]|uniref:Uncharacterized protein n=1 Tax=Chelatococcus sambhunathii TaxID=363953 RepID=A0ABU1DDS6_9HYPH|nr:hypothetical protein [Chelatococcus sambhunathii]MDR4306249.1 hypothetical protein [Chelatococcus sambhunathii]
MRLVQLLTIAACGALIFSVAPIASAATGIPPSAIDGQNDVPELIDFFDRNFFSDENVDAVVETARHRFETDTLDPWRFAQSFEAYAIMFEVTSNKKYALALARGVKLALEFRDDRQGRVDGFTGLRLPAWGVNVRAYRKRIVDIGSQSLVLSPIARLYYYLSKDESLSRLTGLSAIDLGTAIAETKSIFYVDLRLKDHYAYYLQPAGLAALDCNVHNTPFKEANNKRVNSKGDVELCLKSKNLAGSPAPYNIQLKVALVDAYVAAATGSSRAHLSVVNAIKYFQSTAIDYIASNEGHLIFRNAQGRRIEDVTHLNLDVELLFFMWNDFREARPEFAPAVEEALLRRIAASVVDFAAVRDDKGFYRLSPLIDGSKREVRAARIDRSCIQITMLVALDMRIKDVCGSIFVGLRPSPLGLASLIKGLEVLRKRSTVP